MLLKRGKIHMTFPNDFIVLRQTDDLIEIKSRYHYWRITKVAPTGHYILSHKYFVDYQYHKQNIKRTYSLTTIIKYIIRHDTYVSSL